MDVGMEDGDRPLRMFHVAGPQSGEGQVYVAREGRELGLLRTLGNDFQLYLYDSENGQALTCLETTAEQGAAVRLSPEQIEAINKSITAADRWSGPIRENEILPATWGQENEAHERNSSVSSDVGAER